MKKIIACILLGVCVVGTAHQDASDPEFCKGGDLTLVSETRVMGEELEKITDYKSINCPVGMDTLFVPESRTDAKLTEYIGGAITYRNLSNRHDFFDEQERLAYAYASCACASLLNQDIRTESVRPRIDGPESLTSSFHHSLYNLRDGLAFSCYVCKN